MDELYFTNLGKLLYHLAVKNVVIRMGFESGLTGKQVLKLKLTMLNKGRSITSDYMVTQAEIEQCNVPEVIADALIEKLRKAS